MTEIVFSGHKWKTALSPSPVNAAIDSSDCLGFIVNGIPLHIKKLCHMKQNDNTA